MTAQIWSDPDHPTNKLRPRVVCQGCGKRGCVTYWGPWCFNCNVKRMTRLDAVFEKTADNLRRLS